MKKKTVSHCIGKSLKFLFFASVLGIGVLLIVTYASLKPLPKNLNEVIEKKAKTTYFDKYGRRMNITYEDEWNEYDQVSLYQIPEFLQQAFVFAEDKRFYDHSGIDWIARFNALKQNLLAGEHVRGASTLSEQVVKMLHPRPRTLWSRWLEGFEARRLEKKIGKPAILEFYLNQVPYKARRRGVVQASHYYFNRDLSTLNKREMLALAVMVRAPRWYDPVNYQDKLNKAVDQLYEKFDQHKFDSELITQDKLSIQRSEFSINFSHFIHFANSQHVNSEMVNLEEKIFTTIDAELQHRVQKILDERLDILASHNVNNGAVLIVDHDKNEILSWVVGHAGKEDKKSNAHDGIRVLRQPGSTLKPFVYAQAMNNGWTAAKMIDDSPLQQSVGRGLHSYHNYSRTNYGPISLREALGNSLNIPAVLAIQFVTPQAFLRFSHDLGIESLYEHPNVYGDGLALGNGELSLYELVQAYTVLARMGNFLPLSFVENRDAAGTQILDEGIASIIADILSDPYAREKEFGHDSILNFPYQTAIKTGTSSDYRDAWAVAYNDKYTVGIWMGNMDYKPMNNITGSVGPAMVMRAIFNELNRHRQVKPLYISRSLTKKRVCIDSGQFADDNCKSRDEWFHENAVQISDPVQQKVTLRKPSKGLMLAMDPRIPDEVEYFEFALSEINDFKQIQWYINGQLVATTNKPRYFWPLQRGEFFTHAKVIFNNDKELTTTTVKYLVN